MTLLSIDLSSTCTGWSVFEVETMKLVTYGFIKGKNVKDSSSYRATLRRLENMALDVLTTVEAYRPDLIVIEEIAGSKNRISQKTLDMCHGILWKAIDKYLDIVSYYDVSGLNGWRTNLQLKMDDADKLNNKEAKKLNKTLGRGVTKLPIVDWKVLACRHVNRKFGLDLNPNENQSDADVGDSIAMGDAFLQFRMKR